MDNAERGLESPTASAPPALAAPGPISGPWGEAGAVVRHDGWTPALMAAFCEKLAETGLVVDACLAAGKSSAGAYVARRRNRLFAAAWDAALGIARNRLADALLARSIEGNVEHFYKDGELVGERRVIDNRLGLAMLRRLDRLAETGSPLHCASPTRTPARVPSAALDWDAMVGALSSDDPDQVAAALAALEAHEVCELDDPPNRPPSEDGEDDEVDLPDPRVWHAEGFWRTDFPPPPGSWREGDPKWGDFRYQRLCTQDERDLLEDSREAGLSIRRAEDAAARTAFFADLVADLADFANGGAAGLDEGAGPVDPDGDAADP